MFWGLVLEPGKRYSTKVDKSFHVSKAALDCSSVRNDNEILSVILETEGSESVLCSLCKHKGILQDSLDLNFMRGDRLTFECRGHGRIHLSGYLLPEEEEEITMLGDEEESEEEEESEWQATSPEKPKKEKRKLDTPPDVPSKKKKAATEEEESESEGDESDLSDAELEDEDIEDEDDEEGSDKEEEDESEEDENSTLNISQKQKQLQKHDKNKTPNKQSANTPKKTPVANGIPSPKEQKSGKKTPGGDKTLNTNTTPKQKHVLDHGVIVRDLKVGGGPPTKSGKTVVVHYIGKLKETGKVFDKQLKGDGFQFKLGKGEVIKGWDVGLQGMKVGGKRVIHCPPEAAYGSKGIPPKIPPNSTLIFEVELKNVH